MALSLLTEYFTICLDKKNKMYTNRLFLDKYSLTKYSLTKQTNISFLENTNVKITKVTYSSCSFSGKLLHVNILYVCIHIFTGN